MSLIKVVKNVGSKKNYGVEFTNNVNKSSVARLLTEDGEVAGFASMSDKTDKSKLFVNSTQYDVEPLLPIEQESIRILISGESGVGKSVIATMFLSQYENMFPDNQIFFISQKDKSIDRNLSRLENLIQLDKEEIEEFVIDDYENCIFLIDDSDFGKESKKVFELLNLVSTVGREYGISYIFVTHFNSRLNATSTYKEYQYYITFADNLSNNRMLETHMGFSKGQIDGLKTLKSSFYLFNKIFNVLVSDSGVEKFDSIDYHSNKRKIKIIDEPVEPVEPVKPKRTNYIQRNKENISNLKRKNTTRLRK